MAENGCRHVCSTRVAIPWKYTETRGFGFIVGDDRAIDGIEDRDVAMVSLGAWLPDLRISSSSLAR